MGTWRGVPLRQRKEETVESLEDLEVRDRFDLDPIAPGWLRRSRCYTHIHPTDGDTHPHASDCDTHTDSADHYTKPYCNCNAECDSVTKSHPYPDAECDSITTPHPHAGAECDSVTH